DPFSSDEEPSLFALLKDVLPFLSKMTGRYERRSGVGELAAMKYLFTAPFSKNMLQHLMAGFGKAMFFQYSAAADEIGQLTRINPEGLTYSIHASFLAEAGRLAEAEQALQRALEAPNVLRHGY